MNYVPPRPNERELELATTATWGGKPPSPGIRIRKFTPFTNAAGTVAGFLSIQLASGLILNDCKLMVGPKGRRWIGMPAVKQTDRDGNPVLVNGKPAWNPILEFRDRATRDRFEEQVLAALRQAHPDVFEGAA
jgi:DNA-binding cell septation regulator SpoVG